MHQSNKLCSPGWATHPTSLYVSLCELCSASPSLQQLTGCGQQGSPFPHLTQCLPMLYEKNLSATIEIFSFGCTVKEQLDVKALLGTSWKRFAWPFTMLLLRILWVSSGWALPLAFAKGHKTPDFVAYFKSENENTLHSSSKDKLSFIFLKSHLIVINQAIPCANKMEAGNGMPPRLRQLLSMSTSFKTLGRSCKCSSNEIDLSATSKQIPAAPNCLFAVGLNGDCVNHSAVKGRCQEKFRSSARQWHWNAAFSKMVARTKPKKKLPALLLFF